MHVELHIAQQKKNNFSELTKIATCFLNDSFILRQHNYNFVISFT